MPLLITLFCVGGLPMEIEAPSSQPIVANFVEVTSPVLKFLKIDSIRGSNDDYWTLLWEFIAGL